MNQSIGLEQERPNELLALIALLGMAVGIANFAFFCFLRIGLGNDLIALTKTMIILGGICFSPMLLPSRLQRDALYPAITVALSIIWSFVAMVSAPVCLLGYSLSLVIGVYRTARIYFQHLPRMLPLMLLAILITVYALVPSILPPGLLSYATIYVKEFAPLGFLSRDVYFHATLMQMIENYGTVSIGLDGLRSFKYHFGVHLWILSLKQMVGLPVIEMLPVVVRLLLVPLLILASHLSVMERIRKPSAILYFSAALLLCILITDAVGMNAQWVSESHLFSISILFLALAILPYVVPIHGERTNEVIAIGAFCLLAVIVVYCKSPTGLLLLGMAGYLSLRHYGIHWKTCLIGIVTLLALFLAQTRLAAQYIKKIDIFYYIKYYGFFEGAVAPFLPLFALLVIYFLSNKAEWDSLEKKSNKILIEGCSLLSLIAFAVPNIFDFSSGSGGYITDVARWVGIWVLIQIIVTKGSVSILMQGHALKNAEVEHKDTSLMDYLQQCGGRVTYRFVTAAALGIFIIIYTLSLWFCVVSVAKLAELAAIDELQRNYSIPPLSEVTGVHILKSNTINVSQRGYGAALLNALQKSLRESDFKEKTVIYIPAKNFFWEWPRKCEPQPSKWFHFLPQTQEYFIQGMAGLPLLNAWPYSEKNCHIHDYLAIASYERQPVPDGDESDEWICAKAVKRNVGDVLVLEGNSTQPVFRRLQCVSGIK